MVNRYMRQFGADGLFTLLLSTVVVVATCGLSLGWPLRHILRAANNAPSKVPAASLLVVLGMRLRKKEVGPDYAVRLDRVIKLCREDNSRKILIVGGRTGNDEISEAEKGEEYLTASGINPEQIHLEQSSLNTLENLRNMRAMLIPNEADNIALITNRYHLARCELISRGLGLFPKLCGAEDRFVMSGALLVRLLMEAYYIHWYHTGVIWTRVSGSRKSLSRIR